VRVIAPDPKNTCRRDEPVSNNKRELFDPRRASGLRLRNGDCDRHGRDGEFIPEANRESSLALGTPVPRR